MSRWDGPSELHMISVLSELWTVIVYLSKSENVTYLYIRDRDLSLPHSTNDKVSNQKSDNHSAANKDDKARIVVIIIIAAMICRLIDTHRATNLQSFLVTVFQHCVIADFKCLCWYSYCVL